MLLLHNRQVYELMVPLARKQLFTVLVYRRVHDEFDQPDIIQNALRRQSRFVHLRNQCFDSCIVDARERGIAKVWVEPFVHAHFPRSHGGGFDRIALSIHGVIQKPLRLFTKGCAIGGFDELLAVN